MSGATLVGDGKVRVSVSLEQEVDMGVTVMRLNSW
jgi:hypothetical protein